MLLSNGKPATAPAGRNKCVSVTLQVTPLFMAKLSGSMPAQAMLQLAALHSPFVLACLFLTVSG
jgi:hypothetical protein